MPDIQLIVTGDMEKLSLHKALRQAFPDIEFREPTEYIDKKNRILRNI